jgi:CRISPR/Cas system CSM-associated protein Csm2 small subunit
MINDANAFVFVASSHELSSAMILMNLSITYQDHVLINFSSCDITHTSFNVSSFNLTKSIVFFSCKNLENVSFDDNSINTSLCEYSIDNFTYENLENVSSCENLINVSSSHENQFNAKILNEVVLFKAFFTQEVSSTQIRTIRKTSILSASFKKKNSKKSISNSKKFIKKLLQENKNKKFVIERKFFFINYSIFI